MDWASRLALEPATGLALGIATGMIATVTSCMIGLPQAISVWRSRSYRGVSVLMWSLLGVGMSTWIGYGVATRNYTLAIANTVTVSQALILLLGVARASCRPCLKKLGAGVAVAISCVAAIAIGYTSVPILVGALLAAPPIVRLVQVHASWMTVRARAISDVSVGTWTLTLATSVLWTLHGVFVLDPLIFWLSFLAVGGASAVVFLEIFNRRRRRREGPPDAWRCHDDGEDH